MKQNICLVECFRKNQKRFPYSIWSKKKPVYHSQDWSNSLRHSSLSTRKCFSTTVSDTEVIYNKYPLIPSCLRFHCEMKICRWQDCYPHKSLRKPLSAPFVLSATDTVDTCRTRTTSAHLWRQASACCSSLSSSTVCCSHKLRTKTQGAKLIRV